MQTCDQCGTRAPQLPVRIEIVRESGPIGLSSDPRPGRISDARTRSSGGRPSAEGVRSSTGCVPGAARVRSSC